jgi:cob(I)alamin adenosyltransferase
MYHRRVPKTHPQVEAGGAVDELSACLTVVRSQAHAPDLAARVYQIQQDLVALMAELALDPQDWERYQNSTLAKMDAPRLQRLDDWVTELEGKGIVFQDWNLTGFSPTGATLDLARTICRRAERHYWALDPLWHQQKPLLGQYLNRLADVLWLMARKG